MKAKVPENINVIDKRVGMVNVTDDVANMNDKERKAFMSGMPTRVEVTNFFNSMFNEQTVPKITDIIQRNNVAVEIFIQVILDVLTEKGLLTEEEFKRRCEAKKDELIKSNKGDEGAEADKQQNEG